MSDSTETQNNEANAMTHFQLVGEFHDTFGHPQRTQPYVDCFRENPQLLQFRLSLIEEELKEFIEAKTDVDRFDALCDESYVVNGAGQCGAWGAPWSRTLRWWPSAGLARTTPVSCCK